MLTFLSVPTFTDFLLYLLGIIMSLTPFALIFYGFYRLIVWMSKPEEPDPIGKAHGSAQFAKPFDIFPLVAPEEQTESRLPLGLYQHIEIGSQSALGWLLNEKIPPKVTLETMSLSQQQQESHVLVVAPTGKGKTSSIIIPALLGEQGHRSLFINDVKGELIEKCAGALAEQHHILIFSPTRPERSTYYNPLAHVESMEEAEDLAAVWVENTGVSHEEFWNAAAKLLITSTVLHLVETEQQPAFSRLADILCSMSLSEIKDLLLHSKSQLARDIALSFVKSLEGNERLASSILVELATRFFSLRNPDTQQVTASDELDFARMVDEPTALFLSIPANDARRLKPVSSLLIMQLMNYLTKRAERSPNGRLSRPFALYLDELANAGKIRNFTQHLSLVRSAGIAVIAAVQNFGQLRREYGDDDAESIEANTTTHIVLPGCGLEECKYYSEKLGDSTVLATSTSETPFGFNAGTNYSEVRRPLMTPDEIRTMDERSMLVITDTLHPIIVSSQRYYNQPELVARIGLPYPSPVHRRPATPPPPTPQVPTTPQVQQQTTNSSYLSPE